MQYFTRNDDISSLPLSGRALNCLRRANINTVGELLDFPQTEFLKIRNMGRRSLDEIQYCITALSNYNDNYALIEEDAMPSNFSQDVALPSTLLSKNIEESNQLAGIAKEMHAVYGGES